MKLNHKGVKIITIIIYILLVLTYELLYCNSAFLKSQSIYQLSTFRIVMYIGMFIILCIFSNKFIKESLDSCKNSIKETFTIPAMLIMPTLSIIILIATIVKIETIHIQLAGLAIMGLLMILIFIIYVSGNYIKNMIVIGLTAGVLFSLIIPINNQLDEKKHFLAAYNLSLGNLFFNHPIIDEQIQDIPRKIDFEEFAVYFEEEYHQNFVQKEIEDIKDTPAVYFPLLYAPSATGISLARLLGGSIADIYFAGRIFNLFGYLFITCMVLRMLPYKKQIFYVVFLMPMLLALGSIYSIDGLAMGITALFISYCFRLYEQKESITNKQIIILAMLFLLLTIAKSLGYIFVGLLLFILPIKKLLRENRKCIAIMIVVVLVLLFANLFFTYIVQKDTFSDPRMEGTDAAAQLEYIFSNPIEYFKIIYGNMKALFSNFGVMSFLNAPMFFKENYYNVFLYLFIYLFYISITDDSKNFNKKAKTIFLLSFLGVFIVTTTVLYLSYTPVGEERVVGYQARYLFPILPLVMMCLSSKKVKFICSKEKQVINTSCAMGIFLILSVVGALF